MKKTVLSTALIGLFMAGPALAEPPSCDDLATMANALDQLSQVMVEIGETVDPEEIADGSEFDNAMGEIVDGLIVVAEAEEDATLTASVDSMVDAWNNSDWEKFRLSLDSVTLTFARLYQADCP